MRGTVALLIVATACGLWGAPFTADASVEVDEGFVSDIVQPLHDQFIEILGDGMVRVADTRRAAPRRIGHASRVEVAWLLTELSSIDFLDLVCRGPGGMYVDHGRHVSLGLVVSGTSNHVRVAGCVGHDSTVVDNVAGQIEKIAKRATAP